MPNATLQRALACLLLLLLEACAGSSAEVPPNLLLISVDTLRPDHLSCYGYERPTSPAIDALAERGVRFSDVTSASPWTLPSHASLLTGLYPGHHGVRDHVNKLRQSTPTLATLLRARGYATAAIVNSHNLSERYGLDQGFESFEYVLEYGAAVAIPNRGRQVAARARRWLEGRGAAPFFLFLHFYDVHSDFTPAPAYRELFAEPYAGPVDGTTGQLIAWRESGKSLDAADVNRLLALYDAEIRQLDDVLAGLFSFLEQRGLDDHTLVALTSDHGEEFFEHGSVLHGRTHYQEVIGVPLILCGPGLPAGRVVDEPVHLVDIAPTLLALAAVEPPAGLDGIDLGPLWRGGRAPRRELFSEADHGNAEPSLRTMVRSSNLKLIHDRLEDRARLFDLRGDPGETSDLSGEQHSLATELLGALRAFTAGGAAGEIIEAPSEETSARLKALGY